MTQQTATDSPRGKICVSLALPDPQSALAALRPVQAVADVVEIRLDAMQGCDPGDLSRQIDLPLLFTNRPAWEGGMSREPEEERVARLLEAVRLNPAYVDLELKAAIPFREKVLESISGTGTKLIISSHDFNGTPDEAALSLLLQQQMKSGAHIGKIVTMARDHLDVLRVLNLQGEAAKRDFPLIAFCMGEAGRLSRVLTLLLGGFMTYGAVDEEQATAPGQLAVHDLRRILATLAAQS